MVEERCGYFSITFPQNGSNPGAILNDRCSQSDLYLLWGSEPAVRNLNFSIPDGEIFGFLGPSGAGKSTTQKILIGLLRGYQGQVSVLERDLGSWDSGCYDRIGVSFEMPKQY